MPERTLTGVGVCPGRGAGPVVVAAPPLPPPTTLTADDAGGPTAIAEAAARVRRELEEAASAATGQARDVLEATAMMATDPALVGTAQGLVGDGVGPQRAVWEAAARIIDDLRALGSPMAERAADVADVRDRLIAALAGRSGPSAVISDPGVPFVLVATDLAPVDVAMLDPERVRAIVTARGGPVSHTAILARALGIPTVMGVQGATRLRAGEPVVVDGGAGSVVAGVAEEQVAAVPSTRTRRRAFDGTGRTADGHRVPLLANVSRVAEARQAADAGAEGIGLLRTEGCFLGQRQEPSRAEQVDAYRRVLEVFAGRTVVVRTLDAGSDTLLPFLPRDEEPNPALGVRGIRAFAHRPRVLDAQLAAIAEAADDVETDVWVMAPMVTTVADAEDFVARCARVGLDRAGVMIEVPAAALRSGQLLTRAHFASIGTNDLTQYAMAADRRVPELASLCDPWQPAVLDLVATACRGGAQQSRPVGVCGEAAADPALAVVLVGLGVGTLSMTPRALADVAAVLSGVTRAECEQLAGVALTAESAETARTAVRSRLPILDELAL